MKKIRIKKNKNSKNASGNYKFKSDSSRYSSLNSSRSSNSVNKIKIMAKTKRPTKAISHSAAKKKKSNAEKLNEKNILIDNNLKKLNSLHFNLDGKESKDVKKIALHRNKVKNNPVVNYPEYAKDNTFKLVLEITLPILIGIGIVYFLWRMYSNIFVVSIAIILIALAILIIEPLLIRQPSYINHVKPHLTKKEQEDIINNIVSN